MRLCAVCVVCAWCACVRYAGYSAEATRYMCGMCGSARGAKYIRIAFHDANYLILLHKQSLPHHKCRAGTRVGWWNRGDKRPEG